MNIISKPSVFLKKWILNKFMCLARLINLTYALSIVLLASFSFLVLAIILLFIRPLKYVNHFWFIKAKVQLVRMGWSPLVLAMKLARIKLVVSGSFEPELSHFTKKDALLSSYDTNLLDDNKVHAKISIVISNHQAYVDSFFIGLLLHCENSADGSMLWAIWKMFLFTPLGWAAYMADNIFLGYGKIKDSRILKNNLSRFTFNGFKTFCFYPEGGLLHPKLQQKSVAYAKKLNYPVYKYVMLPRVGAFIAAVQRLKEQGCQNIKDVTIGYSRSTPWGKKQIYNLLDALLIHAFPLRVHMHLRQFDISSVGETEEEMKFWLFKRFKEKDCLLYHFDIHQSFSSPDLSPPMEISPSAKLVIKDLLFWMVMQLLLFGFLIKIYFISDDYL